MSDQTNHEDSSSPNPNQTTNLAIDSERLREMVIELELSKERAKELRILSDSLLEGVKALSHSHLSDDIFFNLIHSLSTVLECDAAILLNKVEPDSPDQDVYFEVKFTSTSFVKTESRWLFGSTFERTNKGNPIILADISKLPEWQDKDEELKKIAQSILYIPVLTDDNFAIFMFLNKEKGYYNHKHRELAVKLIPLIQQAIMNLEFNEKIQESLSIIKGKNKQIEIILSNIIESVFIIKSNYTIGKDSSPAFRRLLKQAQCEPKDYIDVLKSLMPNLSPEQLETIIATVSMSIGKDASVWDLNAQNLPNQSQFQNADGKIRLLEWDWSPIEDESGIINEVLISIRDVTELRQLQLEIENMANLYKENRHGLLK